MKFDVENVSTVRKKVNIVLPGAVVDEKMEKQYGLLRRTARIKGFRPGKAPRGVLEKKYKGQVVEEVLNEILKESYPVILEKEGLKPLSYPEFSGHELEKGKDFSFSLAFDVRPEIDPVDYKGVHLKKEKIEISEEEVSEQIEKLRQEHATCQTIEDRGVEKGDTVVIEYERFLNNQPVGEGKSEKKEVVIGEGAFLPGFDEKMVGLKIDEKCDIVTDFPDDYPHKDLAGKSSLLKVHLKEIKKADLPAIDDEFARDVGEFTDLKALKESIHADLKAVKEGEARKKLQTELVDAILEKNSFEVPESMVQAQVDYKNEEIKKQMLSYGMKPEELESNLKSMQDKIYPSAKHQVRTGLLLDAIAAKEGLKVLKEDIEAYYKAVAESTGRDLEEVKSYFRDKEEYLATNLLDNKILDLLLSQAKIEET